MNITKREQWGASRPLPRHIGRTDMLVLHHTVGRYRGSGGTREIDRMHYEDRGWYYGYAYNFGIDPVSLEIFEGRGAMRQGGHTYGYNTTSQAIVVYGDFRYDEVTDGLIETIADLVRYGSAQGWWPDHITHGHKDLRPTSCPGDKLYDAIPDINQAVIYGTIPDKADDKEFLNMLDTLSYPDGWESKGGDPALRNEVRRAQSWLAVADYIAANTFDSNHKPDGLFGPGTKKATEDFQRDQGITVDGIIGPVTWERLAST